MNSRDGIPDDIEDAHSLLSPTDPDDAQNIASSGYSYLEEYINSFYTNVGYTGIPTSSPTPQPTRDPSWTANVSVSVV